MSCFTSRILSLIKLSWIVVMQRQYYFAKRSFAKFVCFENVYTFFEINALLRCRFQWPKEIYFLAFNLFI